MYMNETAVILSTYLPMNKEEIQDLLEQPRQSSFGDVSFPCFTLSKKFKKSPSRIASELSQEIKNPFFSKVEAIGGYVNLFLDQTIVFKHVMEEMMKQREKYGSHEVGEGKKIVIDMSSPNIAKPFSMGHLRSTVIGNSIGYLYEKLGYEVTRINYLGDWGTQFGKLIAAYQKWGNDDLIQANPIKELLDLYVKFHEVAESDHSLNAEGRKWFKLLEDGNETALHLWKWFKDLSLVEFERIYQLLGVRFDSEQGESFYNDKMIEVIEELRNKQLLIESEGAQIVPLNEEDLPPCLILKSDGATLYATRDLASIFYRKNMYTFDKAVYVVGQEQSLHFKQVRTVLQKMNYQWYDQLVHVPFGFILKDGKKMSTRKGKVVLLDQVLQEAISLAMENIEAKNPKAQDKEKIAKAVGVGAIIFHDLKHNRIHDFEFSIDEMLAFEGETGPYLQYTYTRIQSLLRKGNFGDGIPLNNHDKEAWEIIKILVGFPQIIKKACYEHEPSILARLLLDLAKEYNSYYHAIKIIDNSVMQQARLQLSFIVGVVLKEGLRLLGIATPDEM
ncbi:arginine--tRNA ligase [Bacillus sp. DJP31]|uniref:arginine--tRNA ligase n=1 Tax=Bacillus sp. DJP31 TaxID=3409789 RepID=UPI003BB723E8